MDFQHFNLLQLFRGLTHQSLSTRQASSFKINAAFQFFSQEKNNEQIDYILTRLIKGLNSIQPFSRLGMSSTFTLVLKYLRKCDLEMVISKVEEYIYKLECHSKEEETANQLAKVFVLLAFIKSDAFSKLSSVQQNVMVAHVVDLSSEVSLTDFVCFALSLCLPFLSMEQVLEDIVKKMETHLFSGWESITSNHLLLLLKLHCLFPNCFEKSVIKSHYQSKKLLAAGNFGKILNCLYQTGLNREKSALHELAVFVLQQLLQHPNKLCIFIQMSSDGFCNSSSSAQFKAVHFQMVFWILSNIGTINDNNVVIVSTIFNSTFVTQLWLQLSKCDAVLHNLLVSCFGVNFISNSTIDVSVKLATFDSITSLADHVCFNSCLPNSCTFSQLFYQMDRQRLHDYADKLKSVYTQLLTEEEVNLSKVNFVASELRLVASATNYGFKNLSTVLLFYLNYSVFHGSLTQQVSVIAQTNFNRLLDSLASQQKKGSKHRKHYVETLTNVCETVLSKLSDKSGCNVKVLVSELVSRSLKSGLQIIVKDNGVFYGFALVYVHIGLFVLTNCDVTGVNSLLNDVDECCRRSEGHINDGDLLWQDVLMDSMLSLLGHESHLLRTVVKLIVSQIASQITVKSCQVLVDLLLSSADEENVDEEGDDMVDFVDDESDEESRETEEVKDISDDDDDTEDESDDEQETVDDKFSRSVKSALGDAAVQSDLEEDPSDLSDSAMERVDQALALAFKARRFKSKKETERRLRTLIQMKFRCLDVTKIILDYSNSTECRLLLLSGLIKFYKTVPSLNLANEQHHAANRSLTLLQSAKKFKPDSINESDDAKELVIEGLSSIMEGIRPQECDAIIHYITAVYHMLPSTTYDIIVNKVTTLCSNLKSLLSVTVSSLVSKLVLMFPKLMGTVGECVITCLKSDQVRIYDKASALKLLTPLLVKHHPVHPSLGLTEQDRNSMLKPLSSQLVDLVSNILINSTSVSSVFVSEGLSTLCKLVQFNPQLFDQLPNELVIKYTQQHSTDKLSTDVKRSIRRFKSVLGEFSRKQHKKSISNGHVVSMDVS